MYLALETDPELEFEFFLGEKLGKFIHEIRDMPAADFMRWNVYYARQAQQQQLARR